MGVDAKDQAVASSAEQAIIRGEPPQGNKRAPLWRNRDFMVLWGGQTVSDLGSSVSGIALPLLILGLTGSPATMGIEGALARLPYIIFSLPAGALIDRWDRKLVLMVCDAGRALALASIPVAMAFNILTIWQLLVLAFVEGSLFVFFNIAEVAAIPRVVPKDQLPAATAQIDVAGGTVGLVGPGIGGLIYEKLGAAPPFAIDAISYLASVVSLLFVRTSFKRDKPSGERHMGREIREGVAWLWNQPLIRYMAFLNGGLNLVEAASGILIIILARQLGATADGIGLVFSIRAVGGIVGAIIAVRVRKRFSYGQLVVALVWLIALLYPLYAVSPHIVVLGIVNALSALLMPIYSVVQYSYRLALIPDGLQGRVNSSFRLIARGFQPLGALLAGLLVEQFGASIAVLVFSVWLVGLAAVTTLNSQVRDARPLEETI